MLTEGTAAVDGREHPAVAGGGLWLSMSDLADVRGMTKQAVSKQLKRWDSLGHPLSTRKSGRSVLVNVAEFDRLRGEFGDLAREQGEATKKGGEIGTDPIYTREQARKMAYEADLKRLELDEKLKKLVEVDALERATAECAETIIRVLEQIPTAAEDMAASVAKDGIAGARAALRAIVRKARGQMADELSKIPLSAMDPGGEQSESEVLL